jgi:hypothetical protein
VQNEKFETEVRLLKLGFYDMVLGMEWLEAQNRGKMWVDWRRKTMRFKHMGKCITLRGIKDNTIHCPRGTGKQLKKLLHKDAVAQLVQLSMTSKESSPELVPHQVQPVIDKYASLF